MALDPKKWTLKTNEAFAAAVDQAKSLSNPELTPEAFADSVERNGLPQTASFLRAAAELI